MNFPSWARTVADDMEHALAALLPDSHTEPRRLHAAMHYATLGGGKRVRPMLVFGAGLITEAPPSRLQIAAAAMEMIHAYSLVHDDLPCMDDDVLRRGRPTCHVEYDEATALLVGDALQSQAFELLCRPGLCDSPQTQLEMLQLFARACGSHGMAGGQAIDLAHVGQAMSLPELEYMHILKTGALIRTSVLLGAYCGQMLSADDMAHLDRYGKSIGLAFQVVDDILDCESNTEKLGKTAGKDQEQNKPTYVSLMGLTQAKAFAHDLLAQALDALTSFDSKADRLRELANYVVKREH